jgi:UDP:flavonoid glycosyltransferase YjiC (YdhE family)
MARIAFTWELGGELGHAMACSALARVFLSRGHRIAFMFRELHQLAYIADSPAYEVFQAPVSISEGRDASPPASFADILLGCGYDTSAHLTGLLGGWLALFGRWKPDLVISDFAPTALLAARVLKLRRVAYGNGFAIPPRLSPLPPFRFDEAIAAEDVRKADAHALASVNGALAHFGAPPLAHLSDQFETDEDFLATFPELDSYGVRPRVGYWGPRYSADAGASVHWPAGSGKRVLVYLKKTQPQLDALIAALAASPHRVAAFIPELERERADKLRGPRRIVSERPMRLAPLLAECDLFVSTGGNVCVGTLMAGVPQLVFPSQYEQYITGRRIEQLGVGAWVKFTATAAEVGAALNSALEPRILAAARAYANRYPDYSPAEQQRRILASIEKIVAQPSRWGEPHREAILSPTSTGQGAST